RRRTSAGRRALAVGLHVRPGPDHRRRHRPDPEEHHRRAGPGDAARAEGRLMRFALSDEQRLLQDSVDRALTRLAPFERVRRYADDHEIPASDIWRGLADLGVPGLLIAEEHGGLGLGMLEAALVAEA